MESKDRSGISRRDFTKASAAAATAFSVLGAKAASAQDSAEVLKVGLLGCGNRGGGAARQMLQGNDNVKLVAMADLFEDRLNSKYESYINSGDISSKVDVKPEMKFVGFDAYKKILDTDIDILIEGTLPYSRPKHLEAAVEAGKHIFTEKPAAVDPVGIRRVIAAAEKHKAKGLSWVSGTQRRHHSAYRETIKKIHDGAIGDVLAMRVYWCGGLPFVWNRKPEWSDFEYRIRNWYGYNWVCGDNIVEQHVHNLDVANWVLDSHPEAVFASGGRVWKPETEAYGDLWDHFSCDYEYPNGVHVFSMSRHWDGMDGGVFEQAFGSKGQSNCADMGEPPAVSEYIVEHQNLVKSITGEGPYLHEGVQVAHSTLTAIMGRMSAYTGKRITWDEAINSDHSIVPAEWNFEDAYPVGPIPNPVANNIKYPADYAW